MDPLKQAQKTPFFLDDVLSSDRSISGTSNEVEENTKKRNRLSFVCQNCRKSKTKCDREKPQCGRCIRHGIPCVYDVETQRAPKNPSKDATIARLQREAEYWKRKAMKYMQAEEGPTKRALEDEVEGKGIPGLPVLKASRPETASDNCHDDDELQINLYRTHPAMIMNGGCKCEVKPLSENYAITQDIFLSTLLTSLFVDTRRQSKIPAPNADAPVCKPRGALVGCTPSQIGGLSELVDGTVSSNNDVSTGKTQFLLQSVFEHHIMEDSCPANSEYSDTLKAFIEEMENMLPPYEIVQEYKSHFYESIYPSMAFLDEKTFEESLQATLFADELNPSKAIIRLGNSRLRHKMENLCILFLVLKLSYISLQIAAEGSQLLSVQQRENLERYPIGNDVVTLVQRVLTAENFFGRANENIITCLLYMWVFFVFSPQESDIFVMHPSDLIIGLTLMLSMSIGLHRDPSDFPPLKDPSLTSRSTLNHRRMLWLATVTYISGETFWKGRFPVSADLTGVFIDFRSPNALQLYIEKVRNDSPVPPNPEFLQRHEYSFKRAQFALILLDLHKLMLAYHKSFTLHDIEEARNKIYTFLDENFPIKDLKPKLEGTYHQFEICINSYALHMWIIGRLMRLRSSMALFLHFESLLAQNPELLPYYYKYFNQICLEALSLISHFKTFFINTRRFGSLPLGSFIATKYILLAFTSTLLGLLAILVRIDFAISTLSEQYQKEMSSVSDGFVKKSSQKLELIILLKKAVETILEDVHKDASKHLRFSYFSSFKTLPYFDVIIVRMREGVLWNRVLDLQHLSDLSDLDKDFLKSLRSCSLCFCSDANNEQSIMEKLKEKNYVARFSLSQLNITHQKFKNASQGLPKVSCCWQPSEEPLKTSSRNIFQTYEDSALTEGFDKLSSLAALTESMNVQDSLDSTMKVENQESTEGNTPNFGVTVEGTGTARSFPGTLDELDLFDFVFGNGL